MKINLARHAAVVTVVVIVLGAVAATAFRVSTAPDRIRERLKTAQTVCLASGGAWVVVEREPECVKSANTAER